jgi:hypothetical protein
LDDDERFNSETAADVGLPRETIFLGGQRFDTVAAAKIRTK